MKLLRVMHLQSSGASQGTFTLMKSFVLIIKDGKPSGPRPREFKKTSSGTVAFKRIPGKLPRQVCHMTLGGKCQGSVLLLKTFPGSICFMEKYLAHVFIGSRRRCYWHLLGFYNMAEKQRGK